MEAYLAVINKHCEDAGRTEGTAEQYKADFARMWGELGKDVFDVSTLTEYLGQQAVSSKKKYTCAVIAALKGSGGSAVAINLLEQLRRGFRETADSKEEQVRKMVEKQDKIDEVGGDFEEIMNRCITAMEEKIAFGKRPITRRGKTFQQKIPADSITAYRSFIIDCKIRLQGPPPRTDFCNVYSSKERAGEGSYYDGEKGEIVFTSRVKDPHGVKENLPFDVSGIRDELNLYVNHGHAKLLNREMTSKQYSTFIGDMSEGAIGVRLGPSFQRCLYVNQPEIAEKYEEMGELNAKMGHTFATGEKHYLIDKKLVAKRRAEMGKENGKNNEVGAEEVNEPDTDSKDSVQPTPSTYAPTRPEYNAPNGKDGEVIAEEIHEVTNIE